MVFWNDRGKVIFDFGRISRKINIFRKLYSIVERAVRVCQKVYFEEVLIGLRAYIWRLLWEEIWKT
ncbi:hypothetical protein CFS9_20680 [Flavobacterium sp. CFS9]|uniref:Uncharacterized protein n=1 Tax=Flavobacterium sp. CFS9 TaxID=3143118 RepID=A0AAT9H1S2_9FLAO